MRKPINDIASKLAIIILIAIGLFGILAGCRGEVYSFKIFTYPPGSDIDNNDWDYKAIVRVSTRESGPFNKMSKKKVLISVSDRNKKEYLSDKLFIECTDLESEAVWKSFNNLEIVLSDKGSANVDRLKYSYNEGKGKFLRLMGE